MSPNRVSVVMRSIPRDELDDDWNERGGFRMQGTPYVAK